jgi:hypothetical protein
LQPVVAVGERPRLQRDRLGRQLGCRCRNALRLATSGR